MATAAVTVWAHAWWVGTRSFRDTFFRDVPVTKSCFPHKKADWISQIVKEKIENAVIFVLVFEPILLIEANWFKRVLSLNLNAVIAV